MVQMDILAFWITFSVCMAEYVYGENSCPEVMQQLLKDGFHRDLLIRVNLGTTNESTGSCVMAVKVHLPKGLYVDPYELTSLQMHNLTEALVITDDIDLEVPEYLATDVSVLIYMRPDPECFSCFRAILPLHCRYHRPAENGGKISVVLKNPEILIRSQKCKQGIETAGTSWIRSSSYIGMLSDSCYHNIVFQSAPFSFIQAWMPPLFSDITAKLNKSVLLES